MDCNPPGSSVHGIFQARVLEWVAISFSRRSSQPRDRTQVSHTAGRLFTVWATREAYSIKIDDTFSLFIYFIHSSAYISVNPNLPIPPIPLSPACIYICLSISAFQIRSSIPFLESTYNVLIYNICLMEPRENARIWSFPPLREFTGPGGWMLEPGAQSHLDSLWEKVLLFPQGGTMRVEQWEWGMRGLLSFLWFCDQFSHLLHHCLHPH